MFNWIKKYSKWASMFLLGVALIAVYKTFDSIGSFVSAFGMVVSSIKPFIIAFIIAYLLNIPVKYLDALITKKVENVSIRKHSYVISIATVYVLFLIILAVVVCSLLPALFKNLLEMAQNLPEIMGKIVNYINNLDIMQRLGVKLNITDINDAFYGWFNTLDASALGQYAQGLLSVTSGIMAVTSGVMNIFIALIASVYMLIDKERLIAGMLRTIRIMTKSKKVEGFLHHCTVVNDTFTQYIYSRLICCIIMAAACSVVLLVMGEKYALILGLFIGFMDIIPYFGSIIACVVSAVIMLISGGVFHAIWCLIALIVMQQLDGNVLAPRIMGSRLEIRPLTIIIAVSVGGSLFGFMGMLISVPVVAVLRAILNDYMDMREKLERAKIFSRNKSDDGETEE